MNVVIELAIDVRSHPFTRLKIIFPLNLQERYYITLARALSKIDRYYERSDMKRKITRYVCLT